MALCCNYPNQMLGIERKTFKVRTSEAYVQTALKRGKKNLSDVLEEFPVLTRPPLPTGGYIRMLAEDPRRYVNPSCRE